MTSLPHSTATPANAAVTVGLGLAQPPPPVVRPLLAPPPPVHVRLPWSSRARATVPTSSSRTLTQQPGSSAPFASLLVAPPRPLAAPVPLAAPDSFLAAAAAVATAAAWRVSRRRSHRIFYDTEDEHVPTARPCLATRAAGALDGGVVASPLQLEEVDDDAMPPPPAVDAAGWATYRRFSKGARLGMVREWAPLAG